MEKQLFVRLAQVEQSIAVGLQYIQRQRDVIAELERVRHDAAPAKEKLDMLIENQRRHVEEREDLLRRLTPITPGPLFPKESGQEKSRTRGAIRS
jgi:hypothetical protein